jgi:hypothetical protein
MELHKEQERICKQLGNLDRLSNLPRQSGEYPLCWGRLEEAMDLHKEEERICKD